MMSIPKDKHERIKPILLYKKVIGQEGKEKSGEED